MPINPKTGRMVKSAWGSRAERRARVKKANKDYMEKVPKTVRDIQNPKNGKTRKKK